MSRKQRIAKKVSKLILELAKEGIDELDIETDNGLHLAVFIRPINSVKAELKEVV